ncbi:MAG: hypothetical protein AAF231_01135 [Pseudomonadota bacterium]
MSANAPFKCHQAYNVSGTSSVLLAMLLAMGVIVTGSNSASAKQKPRPVVALICDADLNLCRAVVQALADMAPGQIYRINPEPIPDQALQLHLHADSEIGRLTWGKSDGVRIVRTEQNNDVFARQIIARAGSDLQLALNSNGESAK